MTQVVLTSATAVLAIIAGISALISYRFTRDAQRQASDTRFAMRFGAYNALENEADKAAFKAVLQISDEEMQDAGVTPEALRLYLVTLNRLWVSVATSESFGYDALRKVTGVDEKRSRILAEKSYWPPDSIISRMLGSAEFKQAWDVILKRFWHTGDDAVFAHLIEAEIDRRSLADDAA